MVLIVRRTSLAIIALAVIAFASQFANIYPPAVAYSQADGEQSAIVEDRPDGEIENQIREIYAQIEETQAVEISVDAGVVTLTGIVPDNETINRAEELATTVAGVVAIENNLQADVSVTTRLKPIVSQTENLAQNSVRMAPLLLVALFAFIAISWLGAKLAGWTSLWRRFAPNSFIAELMQTTVRVIAVGVAAVTALALLDATAFLSAFLGAAGVLGLAIGFAVRDTIENYISSIMLSIRQPFRPNDHVVIDGEEGRVIRLTSRATVLLTLDGNHLRIPNATVFKAKILNYSRNSDRRFNFSLGVDAQDDPLAGIALGTDVLKGLDFVLDDPAPSAIIKDVGDSNIVLGFYGWVDQRKVSFGKSRSAAISAVKNSLEGAGFALPEPIYRLRFDGAAPDAVLTSTQDGSAHIGADPQSSTQKEPIDSPPIPSAATVDIAPDKEIEDMVEEERQSEADGDLLSESAKQE